MAQSRFCRGSARKMRQVAALVRGLSVDRATAMLKLMPKQAAVPLAKVIASARANAQAVEGTAHHKAGDFVVTDVRVDGGPLARRFRAVGMGRAYRIRKRFCHVRVEVSDEVSGHKPAAVVKAKAEAASAKDGRGGARKSAEKS
ncbi:MAG: 50S ribosomal protein L22 [Candidatus Zixiibacteriota bacterium]